MSDWKNFDWHFKPHFWRICRCFDPIFGIWLRKHWLWRCRSWKIPDLFQNWSKGFLEELQQALLEYYEIMNLTLGRNFFALLKGIIYHMITSVLGCQFLIPIFSTISCWNIKFFNQTANYSVQAKATHNSRKLFWGPILFFTFQLDHLTSFWLPIFIWKYFSKVKALTYTKIFKSFSNVGAFDNLKWRRRRTGILFSWLFHWINWNILKILSDANIVMIDISHSQMTFMITTFDSDKFLLIANIFVTVTIKGLLLIQLVQKSKYLLFEFFRQIA